MAATAEFTPEIFEGERYCGSLYAEKEWFGCVALKAFGLEIEQAKLEGVFENAFDDHITSLTENIITDEEYAEELVFGTPRVRKIVDGKLVSKTGRSIYDIVETGSIYSQKLAENDPIFQHQADRDEGDRQFMEIVDSLEVGEVAHTVSMDPKRWYKTHPELCDSIGYREGMAIQHVAYGVDDETMLMWTYAIKQSDAKAIAQIYKEDFGTVIPEDTNPDLWSRYIHRVKMSKESAEQIGVLTLEKHKQLSGFNHQHYSVDEFMTENFEDIREIFDAYFPFIAIAVNTKQNDPQLKAFAQNIIGVVGSKLKPEIHKRLFNIANSSSFSDDDGRLMKVMMRYATLEKLRSKIPDYKERIDTRSLTKSHLATLHVNQPEYRYVPFVQVQEQSLQELGRLMALDIGAGVSARRSVGGCAGIDISAKEQEDLMAPYNDMFTRAETSDIEERPMDEDDFGPLKFKCPKGHWNRRRREARGTKIPKFFLDECRCGEKLKC